MGVKGFIQLAKKSPGSHWSDRKIHFPLISFTQLVGTKLSGYGPSQYVNMYRLCDFFYLQLLTCILFVT